MAHHKHFWMEIQSISFSFEFLCVSAQSFDYAAVDQLESSKYMFER